MPSKMIRVQLEEVRSATNSAHACDGGMKPTLYPVIPVQVRAAAGREVDLQRIRIVDVVEPYAHLGDPRRDPVSRVFRARGVGAEVVRPRAGADQQITVSVTEVAARPGVDLRGAAG